MKWQKLKPEDTKRYIVEYDTTANVQKNGDNYIGAFWENNTEGMCFIAFLSTFHTTL